jgi:hypothetical protein
MKGPFDVSFGRTPTFFYSPIRVSCELLDNQRSAVTHACCLDVPGDVGEELFVLLGIFAAYKDVERDLSTFQWLQMLG